MTLGLVTASWVDNHRDVFALADTRMSFGDGTHADSALKAYELGGACTMVAAGRALAPMMTAELTRSLITGHERSGARPVDFFNTVRIASVLLRKLELPNSTGCEVAVGGFLQDGNPAIALIRVSPEVNRTVFQTPSRAGVVAFPVGDRKAAQLLLTAMASARQQSRSEIGAAMNMLHYISKHGGMWKSVGGGLCLGTCTFPGAFEWPVISIDDTLYWRGVDITHMHRPGWPAPCLINYDESWCATVDQLNSGDPTPELPNLGTLPGFEIADVTANIDLLSLCDEPDWLRSASLVRHSVPRDNGTL